MHKKKKQSIKKKSKQRLQTTGKVRNENVRNKKNQIELLELKNIISERKIHWMNLTVE